MKNKFCGREIDKKTKFLFPLILFFCQNFTVGNCFGEVSDGGDEFYDLGTKTYRASSPLDFINQYKNDNFAFTKKVVVGGKRYSAFYSWGGKTWYQQLAENPNFQSYNEAVHQTYVDMYNARVAANEPMKELKPPGLNVAPDPFSSSDYGGRKFRTEGLEDAYAIELLVPESQLSKIKFIESVATKGWAFVSEPLEGSIIREMPLEPFNGETMQEFGNKVYKTIYYANPINASPTLNPTLRYLNERASSWRDGPSISPSAVARATLKFKLSASSRLSGKLIKFDKLRSIRATNNKFMSAQKANSRSGRCNLGKSLGVSGFTVASTVVSALAQWREANETHYQEGPNVGLEGPSIGYDCAAVRPLKNHVWCEWDSEINPLNHAVDCWALSEFQSVGSWISSTSDGRTVELCKTWFNWATFKVDDAVSRNQLKALHVFDRPQALNKANMQNFVRKLKTQLTLTEDTYDNVCVPCEREVLSVSPTNGLPCRNPDNTWRIECGDDPEL